VFFLSFAFFANASTSADSTLQIQPEREIIQKTYQPIKYKYFVIPNVKQEYTLSERSSCVSYFKSKFGITKSLSPTGLAKDIPIDTKTPAIGLGMVSYESDLGHISIVTNIEDGMLVLEESNYLKGQVTFGRKLPIDSPLIKGYIVVD